MVRTKTYGMIYMYGIYVLRKYDAWKTNRIMYVCMYVNTHVLCIVYVHMHVSMHCMYVCICIYVHWITQDRCKYACMYCRYIHSVYMYVYM